MAAVLQPTSSKTTVLDLDDDCLKKVFAPMDSKTLTSAADVCTRFKQNTMHVAFLTIEEIRLWLGEKPPSVYEYSMLRNFGEFIEKIEVDDYDFDGNNAEKQIIQYLSLYCVGKSIELKWSNSLLTDEIAIVVRPLLGRVKNLRSAHCRFGEVLLRNLPLWSVGLQESEYGASKPVNDNDKQFDHLQQKNLKAISFEFVRNVTNAHIAELLQQNPQLKEIELIDCVGLDSSVLESIAKNVPTIEKIGFLDWGHKPFNRDHIKYFLQLHELKSLLLRVYVDDFLIQSVVHEIASDKTCLDYLDLRFFDLDHNADLIGGISKLQQLKTLRLSEVKNLIADDLIEICMHAKELSEMYLGTIYMNMFIEDLLEIVKNARKLQEFNWLTKSCPRTNRTNIDGNTFLNLAELVDQRNAKSSLCIYLPRCFFTLTIPADLTTAVNNLKVKLF